MIQVMPKPLLARSVGIPTAVAGLILTALSIPAFATVTAFSDDFEGLAVGGGGTELSDLGWRVGMNVFDGAGTYPGNFKFFDGLHLAPNGGAAYSSVASGDATNGGSGTNYLNVYSNYDCCDLGNAPGSQQGHGDGPTVDVVNALVVKEFNITSDDIGSSVTLTFDAKRPDFEDDGFGDDESSAVGNLCQGTCTASAFVKTLDPGAGFAQTNFLDEDMTSISQGDWTTFSITIDLSDPLLDGQILQVGFQSFAGQFDNSGVYYDNVSLSVEAAPEAVNVPINGIAISVLAAALAFTGFKRSQTRTHIS